MEEIPPTVYLLYGDDDLAFAETIKVFREKLGDATAADLNMERISASEVDLASLHQVSNSLPFLARRRLIIIEDAERLPDDTEWSEHFFELLSNIPASTALVLIEHVEHYRERRLKYETHSRIYEWAQAHPDICYLQPHFIPRGDAFVTWIQQRCNMLGGEIERQAALNLANWVAEDPYLALQELTKLLDYVDRKRPIATADVECLTPYRGQEGIFALVDAIGQRKGRMAQERLHRLLQDEDMRYVFAMVVRQFRLLILAREALDHGSHPGEALPPGTPDFVIHKVSSQARKFSLADLEQIYHHLLWIDLADKTSQLDKVVALDALIAELCL